MKKSLIFLAFLIFFNGSFFNPTLDTENIKLDLKRLDNEKMLKYGVYQIEAGGLDLFDEIHDDMEAIMGLPMKQLKKYLNDLK